MMTIRIYNNSVSAMARSYAVAPTDDNNLIVWLELAPQHPKVIGAIWASLVNGNAEQLGIREAASDDGHSLQVEGLHARYLRLTIDAPRLAGRARPKFLRLIAPQATRIEKAGDDFYVFAWPGLSVGTALAAMLEAGTPTPIRIGWGDYLLAEAARRGYATPLLTGGPVPEGYWLKGETPWADIVSDAVRQGELSLDGDMPVPARFATQLA
ncbi:hypothetical protein FJY94_04605 [Candidatus Kaiserbacteria bacterium]|nr:hypothetical protein [Candidatus Kaiserbacteria bacterium]